MQGIKLLTIGEIKRLARSIPAHLADDTPVYIEVDECHIKIKHFSFKTLLVLIRSSIQPSRLIKKTTTL